MIVRKDIPLAYCPQLQLEKSALLPAAGHGRVGQL